MQPEACYYVRAIEKLYRYDEDGWEKNQCQDVRYCPLHPCKYLMIFSSDPSVKRRLCKSCSSVLVPGVSAKVRVKSVDPLNVVVSSLASARLDSTPDGHLISYSCLTCHSHHCIPVPPVLPSDPQSSLIETDQAPEEEPKRRRHHKKVRPAPYHVLLVTLAMWCSAETGSFQEKIQIQHELRLAYNLGCCIIAYEDSTLQGVMNEISNSMSDSVDEMGGAIVSAAWNTG